ncbi:U-box domain-containing protein 32-like isoform X2 [Malania oleifera]|nr:U-box domain-containing protein 32-like isoform X2 [Malania oleifera]XP_057952849.1 U-box domain-containing protein 32-like isoform X2 [Malania oleifera]
MGNSVEEMKKEQLGDVGDTVFVAVGKNLNEDKSKLEWALKSFTGKRICLLHVHQPPLSVPFLDGNSLAYKLKQRASKAFLELERQKMHKLLNQYLHFLSHEGVLVDKVWIEMESVGKGIIEMIAQHNIRWLVMGAASDKSYSKKMAELKSKKAIMVCQQASISCHIWFACKACLIYTRRAKKIETEVEFAHSSLFRDPDTESKQLKNLRPESATLGKASLVGITNSDHVCGARSVDSGSQLGSTTALATTQKSSGTALLQGCEKNSEDADVLGGLSREISSQCSMFSSLSTEGAGSLTVSLTDEANTSERLYAKEMNQRKAMEVLLSSEKQEAEWIKNQHENLRKELQLVQDQRSVLESRIAESHCTMKDLEDKIFSAVELLITMKKKRDELRIEHGNAIREVKELRKLLGKEASRLFRPQILVFSFLEIIEATKHFDPSQKISEGKYGSVYKGFLRHMQVAIKMLPFSGSLSDLEFRHKVEVLSRIRHPNLVTLVGICPESGSLVYEYLKNGSLEDCLVHKGNTPTLSWQIRTQIAFDISSALIFLHSNNPYIAHGNLRASKVLLDTNFVVKLGDLGIFHILAQGQKPTLTQWNKTNPKATSMYLDQEFLENGEVTPDSDVYSFGVILLQLLTGRPALGIVKVMKCALEKENFNAVLDFSAGEWPLEQARQLANLALWCCEKNQKQPDLVLEIRTVLELMRVSAIASVSCLASNENRRIPSYFVCPILQEVMKDPQIAADGFTYEAEAIEGWFSSGHNTSPMTNLKLEHCNLLPNHALHYAIQEWLQQS